MTIFSVAKRVNPNTGQIVSREAAHMIECFHFLRPDEVERIPRAYSHAGDREVVVVDEYDDSLWLVDYREVAAADEPIAHARFSLRPIRSGG